MIRTIARISAVSILVLVAFQVLHMAGVVGGASFDWILPILATYIAVELLVFSFKRHSIERKGPK